MFRYICFVLVSIFIISCATQVPSSDIINLESGLKYKDLKLGTGKACKIGDKIRINYLVKSSDSTEIENTWKSGRPMSFSIGNNETIKGIDQGVIGMKRGAKRELYIPEELGFFDEKYSRKSNTGNLYILVEFLEYTK